MVGGWRRAFCTTIPKDREPKIATEKQQNHHAPSPKLSSRFGFFSNPSTPRLQSQPVSSPSLRCKTTTATNPTLSISSTPTDNSPKLQCKTAKNSPRFFHRSNPSSPKSPSSFELLRNSLRLSKSRCGICLQNVKTGQGTAIFTAECSHTFHFPCIAAHVRNQGHLVCPECSAHWKELPLLAAQNNNQKQDLEEDKINKREFIVKDVKTKDFIKNLKVYNDDEPLMSPTTGGRFVPIPESDEADEENEGFQDFQGFSVNTTMRKVANGAVINAKNVDAKLLPEAAVVSSVGRSYETYVVVLKVNAPPSTPANDGRTSSLLNSAPCASIDLVTVIDVSGRMSGEKQRSVKRTMRLVISSLSCNDRLSIVAFSASSKRLLPLRRMTANGRRAARRIVDALGSIGQHGCASDAIKKAAKVLEDRRERNPVATIMLLSDGHDDRIFTKPSNHNRPFCNVSSTRFAHLNFPVHAFGFIETGAYDHAPSDDAFAKLVAGILSVVVQDLRLELGFASGSSRAQIVAVYSCTGRPTVFGPGSIRLGDLYAEEERELLIELKVPSSGIGSHHLLTVRSSYKDPSSSSSSSGEVVSSKEQTLLVPRPHAVRSSSPNIQRLRYLFVATRAVAESRRLIERNDLSGGHHLLYSARALLIQSSSGLADEYLRGLEVELAELNWRRQQIQRQRTRGKEGSVYVDNKEEPLTPNSAWRAAERLAKVAIMRKSLNRVSDLHGFENARF